MGADAERSAVLYDRLAAGYDAQVSRPGDTWVRDAFRALVGQLVPTGSLLLDFGCGTGLDTQWYAAQGFRVVAYDNSSGMLARLKERCHMEIGAQRVLPIEASYGSFLTGELRGPQVTAIVSNFAVLNLVSELGPLFEAFAARLGPGGVVVVSVLNPWFWRNVWRAEWWVPCARSLESKVVHRPGKDADTFRHYPSRIERAAQPHFALSGRYAVGALVPLDGGEPRWAEPRTLAERLEHRGWGAFPLNRQGRFLFLVFRKVT